MKKFITGLAMLLVFSLILVACSNNGDEDDSSSDTANGEKTDITFWHAMSGSNGEALEDIVDGFNEQSDDVNVEAIYQGSYDDSLTQLRAVGGSDEAPAIVQVFEIGTKYMSESGFITPMQEFIDADDFDTDVLEPNILSYYELDDQLYSMPFNTSNAVMFYNKDMFDEVGLDPENPPNSFSEMKDASEQITNNADDAYGFTMATIGWFFEQLMANQGALYLDNDNGRSGDATEALVNAEEGLNIFNWLNEMNEAGTFTNYGSNWEDPRGPFFAEQVGMYLDSTANTAEVIQNSPFEVGTAFLPVADGMDPEGVIVGGASLWITNQVPDEDQEAAWEFIKYTTESDVQAEWAAATGYFPITPAAYDEQTLLDVYEENPQFTTAVDQLESTTQDPATAGALTEVLPEARTIIETALGEMYEGRDPQEALDDAASKINDALE
ncbi:sn-glycerol 3-phosphate transport system substrate-binding protein [Virgibacillus natechei]|uniref:Sn-glycerol 3-phosphate transport system substrate-binding protein n=1 Tax=Virgibacillus natechei TaxID=1216297 RepID=A0ABS4IET6_9BACI|nr:ABC transporter substrate-binding protein [Virgibacillus natechei]MBP1969368.1 sn-glycerol 3-phosphate transport system substrate-binding protein [Virgibacillus natechei]UZD12513.1 extracellular solute-binding protein [Virgibacillus natechei]